MTSGNRWQGHGLMEPGEYGIVNHLVEGTGRDGRYRIRYRDRGLGTTGPLFLGLELLVPRVPVCGHFNTKNA